MTVKCDLCKKEFKKPKCHIKRHNFCSRDCYYQYMKTLKMEQGSNWKGGNHLHDGYNFKKEVSGRYRGEHRILMEKSLGRKLTSNEVVHHKDGNKMNNDINNLVVMTRAEHCSLHRPVDKRIDSHADALKFGRQSADVYVKG